MLRRFKCFCQKAVARKQCVIFTVELVVRGLTAAHIVVIHARQVIVDERIRVYHLHGTRKRHRHVFIAAAQLAERKR